MALLKRSRRAGGILASCLFHLAVIAGIIATERWLVSLDAIRPPVLLAEVVTPSDAPPPEIRNKPEPKRPLAAKVSRLLPAPLAKVAEAVASAPAAKPADPEPPSTPPASSAPATASMTAATEPSMSAAPAAAASAGTGAPARASGPVAASGPTRETGAITQTARPQGGYQVRPSYPSSALREGKQGTTMLKVHVLIDGWVGEVVVQRSAGHPDLDQAAMDAVRRWRFDPARRGSEPVAMWVLLPVEFQISR